MFDFVHLILYFISNSIIIIIIIIIYCIVFYAIAWSINIHTHRSNLLARPGEKIRNWLNSLSFRPLETDTGH